MRTAFLLLTFASLSSGCAARTAAGIVTAPVQVAGKAADWSTTSQSEADEKRGREMRQREEERRKLQRRYERHLRECDRGNRSSCMKARDDYAALQMLAAGNSGRDR